MKETAESVDYPKGSSIPTEPMRCNNCGNLFGFYSGRSDADLLLRCPKCSSDYDIRLLEGGANCKRRNKRKTPSPTGQ